MNEGMNEVKSAWHHFQQDFSGKKVAVFGLGRQGGGSKVANTLARAHAQVTVFDALPENELREQLDQLESEITVQCGVENPDLTSFDCVIKNPAVPFSHPSVEQALQIGIPVVGETALALRFLRDRSIGITGTRGKTTTTTLTGKLLEAAGKRVLVGGNIPQAPALSLLPECDDDTWVVLEISSFQLESFAAVRTAPHIAVVTNVYPDHLNRYDSLESYARTKAEVFHFQQPGDVAFFGGPEQWHELIRSTIPAGVEHRQVNASSVESAKTRYHTMLPGDHNWENIAMVDQIRSALGLPEAALQAALDSFTGVPYRLETVRELEGVRFVNDTTSTTPVALEKALDSYTPQSCILIAGGTTKHLPLERSLLEKFTRVPVSIFLLPGSGSTELQQRLGEEGLLPARLVSVPDLQTAVQQAYVEAKAHSIPTVVFSPGFTSFQMFKNEFDRGDHFNQYVRDL